MELIKSLKLSLLGASFLILGTSISCGKDYPVGTTEYNLDFEYAWNDSVPMRWTLRNASLTGYGCRLDRQIRHHGTASLRVDWSGRMLPSSAWGGFQTFLPAAEVAGREVEISGWIRTCDSLDLRAGFGIFPFVPDRTPMDFLAKIDTAGSVCGTSDWRRCTIRRKIDEGATSLLIGGYVTGKGCAWFDDLEIRVDGRKLRERRIPRIDSLSAQDRQELLRYLHPLRTCDPDDADYTDLEPLGRVAAASRIVGLGEGTHGSDEIFAMKDRIVRYLASRQGFNLFALEANRPEALRVNDYTIRGEGDPKQLIRGMYVWPWMTEEMLMMVEWMKGYNASEPRMTFTGVDLQMPATLMGALQRLLPGTGSATRRAAALAEQLRSIYDAAYRVDVDLARSLEPELDTLAVDPQVAALPAAERAEVEGYIGMLRGFLSQYRDPSWRDRGMASTLEGILQQHASSRAVLWAHNQHVNQLEGTTKLVRPTGYFLKEAFGDGYLSVGLLAGEGTYMAWRGGLRSFELPAPAPGTLEHVLEQLGEPIFLLDLKRMREEQSPLLRWIDDLAYREIGATPEIFHYDGITEAFDCLIFIQNTSASNILRF